MRDPVLQLMTYYPQVYFACHTRHVRDPRTHALLSAHQASVLDHLDEIEGTNLRTLAAHMGVTASTMSLMVSRLVRRRYVIRKKDTRDARQVNLLLTKSGARIKSAKSVLDPVRVKALLHELRPDEQRDALRGLALLAQAAHRAMSNRNVNLRVRGTHA